MCIRDSRYATVKFGFFVFQRLPFLQQRAVRRVNFGVQLGESFPITIVTFLPVLLLLFLERISVKKLMIALGIGAGLTAFN